MIQFSTLQNRLSALALALALTPGLVLAQAAATTDQEGPSTSGKLEEVTVTARKRVESELDVPIAISALTSKDIYQNGISSLEDIALYTPGVALDNDASDHVSRQFQSIFIRGMVETSLATPNVSVFIDGAPVSAGFIPGVEDAERVEVLKGPQSAFFGRETFAGAVNIVTKEPSNSFSGSLDALYGNDDWYDIKASLEGPISDTLSGRVSFRDYSTLGQYKSSLAPYTDLGAQGTKSLNIAFTYKPTDSLTIRPYLTFWNDDDGPAPAVKFNASNYNCNAGAGGPNNYICGTLPTISSTNLPVQGTIDNLFRSQIFGNASNSPSIIPLYKDLRASDGFTREAFHGHLIVDWKIPDSSLTLTSVTSGNVQESEDITTLDDQDVTGLPNFLHAFIPNTETIYSWFSRIQTYNYDFAQEFRLSSDQNQPLRWTGGVNYAKSLSSTYVDGLFPFGVANFGGGGPQTNETGGLFGSITYDITSKFSATIEGRWQTDTIAVYNRDGVSPETLNAANRATDFLPRASVQYKFTPDAQVYFTYSRGVNPGSFNTDLVGIPAQILQNFETLDNASIEVKPEYLQNFEFGVKGRFLDGRIRTATDVYFDQWTHQILNQFVSVPGIPSYDAGQPDAQNVQVNGGDTHLYGLETDIQFQATHALVLSLSGAINRSIIETYPKFRCNSDACTAPSEANPNAYTNINGNALPNAPEFAANAAATYTDKLTANLSWYGRADYIYKSSEFTDLSNLTKIGASNRVNFRLGLFQDKTSVELFVLNAFNNKQYTSVNGTTDIDGQPNPTTGAYPYAVIVGPPMLRQFGIRARYHF